jgi:flagellar basal-body rod protein FlgB
MLGETPMPISGLPILGMLRTKMQWHQERQRLLAENISNADTPKYRPHDLAPLKLDSPVSGSPNIGVVRTSSGHLGGLGGGGATQFQSQRNSGTETRPGGNAVNLEDEMLKVAENQMDYQAATGLYVKSLGLVKSALGRR